VKLSYVKKFSELYEEEARSVTAPQPLLDDIKQITDHINKILLRPFKAKAEGFTYSSNKGDGLLFTSSAFVGDKLGVFGAAVAQANMTISIRMENNTATGPLRLEWSFPNKSRGEATIGSYRIADGQIIYIGADGNEESIGTSKFAIASGGQSVHDTEKKPENSTEDSDNSTEAPSL
jgi:hypothetical protein